MSGYAAALRCLGLANVGSGVKGGPGIGSLGMPVEHPIAVAKCCTAEVFRES
jgi:hypothetical protein